MLPIPQAPFNFPRKFSGKEQMTGTPSFLDLIVTSFIELKAMENSAHKSIEINLCILSHCFSYSRLYNSIQVCDLHFQQPEKIMKYSSVFNVYLKLLISITM